MKHRNWYSVTAKATALAMLLGGANLEMNAQDLVNESDGKIHNTGTIKFKKAGAKLTNNSTQPVSTAHDMASDPLAKVVFEQDGVIMDGSQPFGGDATTNRFPGNVVFAGAGAQTVNGTKYYTNLELSGAGAKSVADAVYVSNIYTAAGGDRTYNGTFYYDGADQRVFAEVGLSGTTNQYNNLELQGTTGIKSLNQGDAVKLKGTFASLATAPFVIGGQFEIGTTAATAGTITVDSIAAASLTTGSGLAAFNGNVTVTKGQFIVPNAGLATIGNGATLALADDTDAKLSLGTTANLTLTGDYTNAFAALTNATYDATSTVLYNKAGAQTMMAAVTTNPYGNLSTAGGGLKTANGNIFMATNLNVDADDIDMATYELNMTTAATATYVAGTEEVRGKMTRTGTFATATDYVYNNRNTQVNFASGTMPASYSVDARPATAPLNYDALTDINRKITVSYTGASTDWLATVRAGYKTTDIPAGWDPLTTEDNLRFVESEDVTGNSSPYVEKVATGVPYTRGVADAIHYVSLAGIGPDAVEVDGISDGKFRADNDLVLRGGPTIFNAIANGRWSNPATWDEGLQPAANDRVVINGFTVHAGYVRATDNFAGAEDHPDNLAAAVNVGGTVLVPTAAGSGLLFGSTGALNAFSMTANTTVTNKAGALAGPVDLSTQDVANSQIEGLIIYLNSTLQSDDIVNEGRLGNGGDVEVGD